MPLSRELVLCVALSALTSTILFLYFRNKFAVVENKVNVMFDLIQNHPAVNQPPVQMTPPDNIQMFVRNSDQEMQMEEKSQELIEALYL